MTAKQDRSNAYLENRLKRDHPNIHADWIAGRYGNVMSAAIAAGLKKPRTRLHELKNAWLKASDSEKDEFEKWLLAQTSMKLPNAHSPGAKLPIAIDRRLQPWAKSRIKAIMAIQGLQMGDVMADMGLKRLDASIGYALRNDSRLRPGVISALESLLDKHKHT